MTRLDSVWSRFPAMAICNSSHAFSSGTSQSDLLEDTICHHTILLPGRNLYLTPLLDKKKYRGKGNREGALLAFRTLQETGLGDIHTVPGTKVCTS